MTTDAILTKENQTYDISFDANGDIKHEQSFETAIIVSLFEERRAAPSEVPQNRLRRGWIGNDTNVDFEQGSKFWLYEQERLTATMLADLGTSIRNCLQWLVDGKHAKDIFVKTPFLQNGIVWVSIDFIRLDSSIESSLFDLWSLTDFKG